MQRKTVLHYLIQRLNICLICLTLLILPFKQSNAQSIPNPCTVTANHTVPSNATVAISTWYPSGSSATGKVIDIQPGGTLKIDKAFNFSGCTFRCGNNASIVTDESVNGITLTAVGCQFFTCTDVLWQGITLNNNAKIILLNSRVRDAVKAIYFPPGYTQGINAMRHNVFDNNQYSLYLGSLGGGATVGFTSCWNNRFQQSASVKAGVTNSHSGVYLRNSSTIIFGTSGGPKNVFQNMYYGVFATGNSNVTVSNSDFLDMDISLNPFDGTGIYAQNSTLMVTQAAGTDRCLFDGSQQGIWIRSAVGPSIVQHADFNLHFIAYGIRYEMPQSNTYIQFEDNTFNLLRTSRAAIFVQRPADTANISNSRIANNHIIVAEGSTSASCQLRPLIQVQGNVGGLNILEISNNQIENFSECYNAHGIYIDGFGDQYEINQNLVEFLGDANRIGTVSPEHNALGIVFTDMPGTYNKIEGNSVISRLQPDGVSGNDKNRHSFIKCGIHVVNCYAPTICDNYLSNTYRGYISATLTQRPYSEVIP
ncbi:MAG: hypothetical protein IT259_10840 [Saprospiraceae bacterium]|nr:hypothetical protein [Saprospiraceae bacterium]